MLLLVLLQNQDIIVLFLRFSVGDTSHEFDNRELQTGVNEAKKKKKTYTHAVYCHIWGVGVNELFFSE